MNKKGFTLVEILATIVLIALLLGLGIPGVMKISKNMKQRSYNTKVNLIEQAGTLWGQDNKTRLQSDTCELDGINIKCHKITIESLIKEDYLEADNINVKNDSDEPKYTYEYISPIDNTNMAEKCVWVYKKNNRVYAKFVNDKSLCEKE